MRMRRIRIIPERRLMSIGIRRRRYSMGLYLEKFYGDGAYV